ncbi:hypothetical protein B0A48_05727 [Cryoendolithus antarcticus]|uniref:Uncharacterized protein n=1 Tax=Cryoendolithus antarcticus TaxID=1507870 RepID=A0A1V8TBR7_9PEZI|nr:hypothetical protein B0A48_05727 [Cryoendolithus antarcticus]OQO16289.1 hypothetical protein B0A51_17156 [Rachicladosporium sp. CCFEE 5018]
MCLLSPKVEQEYTVPARVTRVRRTSRVSRRSPSPPRVTRIRESIIEERRPSPERTVVAPPTLPPSPRASTTLKSERRTSRAPSVRNETHFVEVEHESDSSSSSDDVRSRTTSHTRKTSRSKTTAPVSEYSLHERETRRERDYGSPKPEYETYRYVEAPKGGPARSRSRGQGTSFYDGPRASQDAYRRERVVTEDEYGRRRREYQR